MPGLEDKSSSDGMEAGFGGLSPAACHLGRGAVLYIQMLKTLSVMFIVLSLVNVPIFLMYNSSTINNNYKDVAFAF